MTNASTEPVLLKVKRKREQPAKQAEVSAEPVDFKALAAETRAKMRGEKPAEVSVAPELPMVPEVAPGTIGMQFVPLHQLVRSSCNVRNHYDPAAVDEMAESLASKGQLENLTGRWNAEGQVETVAGETRRRGWMQLRDQGRVDPAQPVLVYLRDLSDAEALEASATENMKRRSMTPLEECEAMARMQDAGRTVEDITATFGFKSQQPVANRILAARNLHPDARVALDEGRISLAHAYVMARVPGADLQKTMLRDAAEYRHTAASLAQQLTRGQFLVKDAQFNVQKAGLEVVSDLYDAYPAYFKDKSAALQAQIEHANTVAERRIKKGGRAFVAVETGDDIAFSYHSFKKYDWAHENDARAGTVIYVSTATGELSESRNIRLKSSAGVQVADNGTISTSTPKVERQMPDSAYLEAHHLRAAAARAAAIGNTHLTLALTVWGMIQGSEHGEGRVNLGEMSGLTGQENVLPVELQQRLTELHILIDPTCDKKGGIRIPRLSNTAGHPANPAKLLALLLEMTDEVLLGHLNTLVAVTAYDWSTYNNARPPAPVYVQIAALTGAADHLTRTFKLTDEWLKRYPRPDLVKLAEEAGLGRALVEDCKTLKEMRGRILEHADKLHAEGFVPVLVRFPKVKGVKA